MLVTVALLLAGCGGEDFENKPRPAVPLQIAGVVTTERVTVSPKAFGAGPVVLTISNQDERSHTITLEGESTRQRVGPVNPLDTATLQATLAPGRYEVKAGSDTAVKKPLSPAVLEIGPPRDDSSDEVLLP